MPEQEKFKSMHQTGESPVQAAPDIANMEAGEVPMPIGRNKGKKISDVARTDLEDFMKMYNNLNKIAAMETPPPNYVNDMQLAHQKMKEFIEANKLEGEVGDIQTQMDAAVTPIEKQVGDEAFRVPDGFMPNMVGRSEIDDIRKLGTNRLNILLSKISPVDVERYPDFVELIKTYVNQLGAGDKGMVSGEADVVPKDIFMGEYAKFVRQFGGQPISNLDDNQLAGLHRYFTYTLYKDAPNKFQAHKGFYDNITKILLENGTIREMDGQYLYPKDIIFFEKYKNSKPVGSIGEEAYPIDVEVIKKVNPREVKRDNAGNVYFQWLFKETGTPNIIEYRDYTPLHSKSKDHEGLTFDKEMMGLRRANAASIEADIAYHNTYKGVMRTRIKSPVFIETIRVAKSQKDVSKIAKAASAEDDLIRRNKELDQMIPKDTKRGIEKSAQRQADDKSQEDKLKDLANKYRGESVKKEKPSLNEHVERLMNISNYKRIIK